MYEDVLRVECGYNGATPYVAVADEGYRLFLTHYFADIGTGHKMQTYRNRTFPI